MRYMIKIAARVSVSRFSWNESVSGETVSQIYLIKLSKSLVLLSRKHDMNNYCTQLRSDSHWKTSG